MSINWQFLKNGETVTSREMDKLIIKAGGVSVKQVAWVGVGCLINSSGWCITQENLASFLKRKSDEKMIKLYHHFLHEEYTFKAWR